MKFLCHKTGQIISMDTSAPLHIGGEGRIYPVFQDPSLVAKIYARNRLTADRIRKLLVMLAHPPDVQAIAVTGHIPIAWPVDLIRTMDEERRVVGFLMPRVTGMYPVSEFYNPGARRRRFPRFNTRYLHRAAHNLAAAVHALHHSGYVIGDVNESNIFVSNTALVTIVDTDSFQVCDPLSGALYRCEVGRPEFTPPELQGARFTQIDRRPDHDHFGLAVLIFQLLMEGIHPFEGVFQQSGEPPSFPERITAGHFPYGGNPRVPYRPRPAAPPVDTLHPPLQVLFKQCFEGSQSDPSSRPSARTWQTTLAEAEYALILCDENPQHWYSGHRGRCPWCERMTILGLQDPFPSRQAIQAGVHQRSFRPPSPEVEAPKPAPAFLPVLSLSYPTPRIKRMTPHKALSWMIMGAFAMALVLGTGLHPVVLLGLMAAGCGALGWQHAMTGRGTTLMWTALGLGGAMILFFLGSLMD